MRRFLKIWFVMALAVSGSATLTNANTRNAMDAQVCDAAAIRVAAEMGVPENVLLAITRTETARFGEPWPWTVNMEGDGHWFDTRSDAEAFAERRYRAGARSFDIGCFQINHRWHGDEFTSITSMFEPVENARYAARFLIELYGEFGSWDAAVGAYHSRTERYATRYLRIYHGHLETLGGRPDMAPPRLGPVQVSREQPNTYPLLQSGANPGMGSLVPQDVGSSSPLLEVRP